MVARQPQNFTRRINNHVPALSWATDVIENGLNRFSLGSPTVALGTSILTSQDITAASSTTTLSLTELTGTYGRNVTIQKPTGGATGTITITGRDYLGQPMKETIASVAATATVVQGRKAFKYIDEVGWTLHASSTLHVGHGNRLGLPYVVENFHYAYENNVRLAGSVDTIAVRVTCAALNVAATNTGRAPVKGNVVGCRIVVSTVIGAGAAGLTFNVNGGTTIGGLTTSVTAAAAVGTMFPKAVPNLTANCAVVAGDALNVINDAVTASGAVEVEILIQPDAGVLNEPIYTDPQTLTTGDPRGTYEPFTTLNGATPIEVVFTANRTVNASGRGGLHGIAQFFS